MSLVWNWWAVPGSLVFIGAWTCAVLAIRTAPHKPLNRNLCKVLILEGLFVGCNLGFLFFFENRGAIQVFTICGTAALLALPFQYLSFLGVSLKTPLVAPFKSPAATVMLGATSVLGATLVLLYPQLFISELYEPDFAPWNFRYDRLGLWAVQFHGAIAFFGLLAAISAYLLVQPGSAARNRAKWFAISFGVRDIYLGITLMSYPAIRPIPFWGDFIFNPGTALVYFVYVLLLAYAVLKMQLFDIHLKVKFVIQNGTAVALAGGIFLISSEILEFLLPVQASILAIGVALVILALFKPIHRLALRLVGGIMQGVEETTAYLEGRKIEVYQAAFEGAMEDGVITQKERTFLSQLRQKLELSDKNAEIVEQNFTPRETNRLTRDSLLRELKRRNVDKIAIGYVVLSWVLLQVAAILLPAFELPDGIARLLAITLLFGFPFVLLFAWSFQWTPQGIKKTPPADPGETVTIRKRDYVVNAALVVLIGVVAVQQLVIINSPASQGPVSLVNDKSIAVLPLVNLSLDPDNVYFAAGVHEEILNQLAKISEIQVVSRAAVLRYQNTTQSPSEIARELNVSTILGGSVQFADNSVKITTSLVRATDDIQLWSETYQFELDDIFAIQSDVALRVADAMKATLLPAEIASIERPMTESTEAYTLYLQYWYQYEQETVRATLDEDGWLESGIVKLERAIELDPNFAQGIAELGWLLWSKGRLIPFEERNVLYDEAIAYARQAIELDPTIARAYVALQRISFERRQWDEWLRYASRSAELPDLNGRAALNFAITLNAIGQFEEGQNWYDVAISKQPSLPFYRELAIRDRIFGRDYETALAMTEQYRAVGGEENVYHILRAYALNRLGRQAEFLEELSEISTEDSLGNWALYGFHDFLRCQSGEQVNLIDGLEQQDIAFVREIRIQYCAAGTGDLDRIFESLQRTMVAGQPIWYTDVFSDEVRNDPRWQTIDEYMNLPIPNSQIQ